MYTPKVSIITVCYNSEQTIEQTIQSVLCQTYKNIEYIIMDGGSQDNTLNVINKYKEKIMLFREPDDGIFHAMNKGIMRSSGEILGIINSDDWYENDAVETVVKCFQENNCDLVYGGCTNIYENDIRIKFNNVAIDELKYRMVLAHPTVFVKKSIYEKYGIFNQKYRLAADYDLMLRFYECGVRMLKTPENIAFFRMSGISRNNYDKTIEETKEIALSHWDGYSQEIKQKIEKYSEDRKKYNEILIDMVQASPNIKKIILDKFSGNLHYTIFGAGDLGIKTMILLQKMDFQVDFFVDNDAEKWGKYLGGIEIRSPKFLQNERIKIIITNLYYREEIRKQLLDMHYNVNDFSCIEDILEKCQKIE